MFFRRRERMLGNAEGKRRYDLPLNKGEGAGFLTLLIGLMTFLAMLALTASFLLSAMTDRWSSGLENSVTVEIPAEGANGAIMPRDDIRALTDRVAAALEDHEVVAELHILSDQEITDLVKPWLGDDLPMDKIPVPGLITVTLKADSPPDTANSLNAAVRDIAPRGRVDTHETWLNDLMRFTGALQLAAALLTIAIGATAATAVAGAVRSRMAVYAEEVKLLHLMGATDRYIARQFERHSLLTALRGGIAGIVAGGVILFLIGMVAGRADGGLLPGFQLGLLPVVLLCLLPVLAGMLALFTAGRTVYSVLSKLP